MSVIALAVMASVVAADAPPLSSIYRTSPSFTFPPTGTFATGAVLTDLNRDGILDLVVASGNDMSPQPVTVYYGRSGSPTYTDWPQWYSSDIAYNNGVSAADVDGDGWPDVAVSVGFGLFRELRKGQVKLYRNRSGRLDTTPSWTAGEFVTLGCALADVDADGRPDLIAAVLNDVMPDGKLQPGRARIYRNRDGKLETTPSWTSEGISAVTVVAADVDQDGWMDLAFASARTAVFYGTRPAGNGIPFSTKPSWQSTETHAFPYDIDAAFPGVVLPVPVGTAPSADPLMLAIASGCRTPCPSYFGLYRPDQSESAIWKSPAVFASKLVFGDLNGDGIVDLAAGQWGESAGGAPLSLFQGAAGGFPVTASLLLNPSRVSQQIVLGDLRNIGLVRTAIELTAVADLAVVTLPVRQVAAVRSVTVGGRAVRFSRAAQSNAVALDGFVPKGARIRIEYDYSPVLDIVAVRFNPQFGADIYNSFLTPK